VFTVMQAPPAVSTAYFSEAVKTARAIRGAKQLAERK
jgi:hypothetical protein